MARFAEQGIKTNCTWIFYVLGILIPASWTAAVGIDENLYHLISASLGTLAGVLVAIGLIVLVARRLGVSRRATQLRGWPEGWPGQPPGARATSP